MTFKDGRYSGDSQDQILDSMIAEAKEYWGTDLSDEQLSTIRLFYSPVAGLLSEVQADIAYTLQSAQIDYAEDQHLDLLTSLIGVTREPSTYATGEVRFYRDSPASKDYIIPSGTTVQTDETEAVKYETQSSVTLSEGTSEVYAEIESLEAGVRHNAGPNTATIIPSPPAGVESVNNPAEISGGSEEEIDRELRSRAKEELSEGSRASAPALINSVSTLQGVTSTAIFVNDTATDNTGSGGLPEHSFELVVNGGNGGEISQAILNTKAAGDTSYSGVNGEPESAVANLPNGQTMTVDFSRPENVAIYIDVSLEVNDEFTGTDSVKSNIVRYVGGLLASGNEETGELQVGDDVIYGEVEYAIRDTPGVYDVTSLTIDTTSSPTGTSNIPISNSQVATSDGTDTSMNISTTEI